MYTNIPIRETVEILKNELYKVNTISSKEIDEAITLLKTVLAQNDFTLNEKFYI